MKSSSRNETNQRICLCKQAHVLLHVFIFHDGVQIVCVTKLGPKEKSSYFLPSGECIIYVNWISIIIPSTINFSKSRTDQLSKENARSVHVWRLEIQILARLVQWSSTNFCRWSYFSCLNLRDYSHNDFLIYRSLENNRVVYDFYEQRQVRDGYIKLGVSYSICWIFQRSCERLGRFTLIYYLSEVIDDRYEANLQLEKYTE